jgi:hypothetical protein
LELVKVSMVSLLRSRPRLLLIQIGKGLVAGLGVGMALSPLLGAVVPEEVMSFDTLFEVSGWTFGVLGMAVGYLSVRELTEDERDRLARYGRV